MKSELGFLYNMIYAGRREIAEMVYPHIDEPVQSVNSDEDGIEWTVTIQPTAISMATAYFEHRLVRLCENVSNCADITDLSDVDKMTAWHLISVLWSDKTNIQETILNKLADDYYESDGHYETGNTHTTNRVKYFEKYNMSREELRQMMKKLA